MKHDVEKLRYIRGNLVKRGLVTMPEQWLWSSYRHYQTGMHGTVEIESKRTACEGGLQLPAWMRNRQFDSPSPVPPPRRTRDRGHPQLDHARHETRATRRSSLST
jgi:hypothetical protein